MLSNKVSEIMTTHLITAAVTASVFEVMEKMVAEDVGRIIVTDDDVPVGIFTEKDVLKRVVNSDRPSAQNRDKKSHDGADPRRPRRNPHHRCLRQNVSRQVSPSIGARPAR
jgi:CBS domain-containing protein